MNLGAQTTLSMSFQQNLIVNKAEFPPKSIVLLQHGVGGKAKLFMWSPDLKGLIEIDMCELLC